MDNKNKFHVNWQINLGHILDMNTWFGNVSQCICNLMGFVCCCISYSISFEILNFFEVMMCLSTHIFLLYMFAKICPYLLIIHILRKFINNSWCGNLQSISNNLIRLAKFTHFLFFIPILIHGSIHDSNSRAQVYGANMKTRYYSSSNINIFGLFYNIALCHGLIQ